jgi:hypothetical protein
MTLREAIEASLRDDPPDSLIDPQSGDAWRAGFDVARRIRAILAVNGCDRPTVPETFQQVVEDVGGHYGWDPGQLFDLFALTWGKIRLPEGEDTLTVAWGLAVATPESLKGAYPSETMRQVCGQIAGCARLLSEGRAMLFLPCRRLAELAGRSYASIARSIRLLQQHGVLRLVQRHTRYHAAEYQYIPQKKRAAINIPELEAVDLEQPASVTHTVCHATKPVFVTHSLTGLSVDHVLQDQQCGSPGPRPAPSSEKSFSNSLQEPDPEASENKEPEPKRKARTPAQEALAKFDREWPRNTKRDQAIQIAGEAVTPDLWDAFHVNVIREAVRHIMWDEASGRNIGTLREYCEEHRRAMSHVPATS